MKYLLLVILACLFSPTIFAQPVNDNACDATLLSVDAACSGNPYTTASATSQSGEPTACGSQTNSVWFKFVAPASGAVRIFSSGSTVRKSLYSVGDCPVFSTYTRLQCTFGGDIWHSGLAPGTEYQVRVTSSSAAATFCLSVMEVTSMPANDAVCSATLIQLDSACTGNPFSNATATRQTGEPASCSTGGQTLWFKFTAPADGAVRVLMNSEFMATAMYSLTGDCGNFNNFTELRCVGFGDPLEASGLTPDSTYYIQSTSLFDEVSIFCLTVETVLPPTNDSACAAILLAVDGDCFSAPYSLTGATSEPDEPDSCFSSATTAWFKFVVPSGGAVEVDTWSSNFWSVANVLTVDDGGDFSTYSTIGCAGYNGPAQLFGLTAGDTVFIQINSYDGYTGSYCIAVDTLFQWFADFDEDGYGDPNNDFWATWQQYGHVADSSDCNGTSASIYPGATEICDGLDNDCDSQIDEGVGSHFFADTDGDGFGNAAQDSLMCSGNEYFVADSTDCNDANATIYPNAPELCDGLDNDCDGQTDENTPTWYADADADGFGNAMDSVIACTAPSGYVINSTDCDDAHAAAHPGAAEICDNLDNNCNGQTDEGLLQTFYADADGDGFGNSAADSTTCATSLTGYVSNSTDCNDANASAHPGGAETCDLADNDCDGTTDEGFQAFTYYADADGDGFGNAASTTLACVSPPGYTYLALDCDDTNAAIHYGATELCDNIDNDCDGQIDDGVLLYFFLDADADGYGEGFGYSQNFVLACSQPAGYAPIFGDCDDTNPAIHTGATEICNGLDDNCNGAVDDNVNQFYYLDGDGDGYGNPYITQTGCTAPSGYVSNYDDCHDGNPNIHPGAAEICGNKFDDDCNGTYDISASLSPASPLICIGGNVTLVASGGTSYNWSNGATTASNTVSPAAPTTYMVTVTQGTGQCTAVLSKTVTVSNDQAIGNFGSRTPANGMVNVAAVPTAFTWSPMSNVEHFDLFVWPANLARPVIPTASLTTFSYALNLTNAVPYRWQLRAYNDCHSAWSDTLSFTTRPLPDLVVSSMTAPSIAGYGQTISVSWQTQNMGQTGTGSARWFEELWLSSDSTFSFNDRLLGSWENLNYLNPDETYAQTRFVTVPVTELGDRYLIAKTGIGLAESNHSNNDRHVPIQIIIPPLPDLRVVSVAAPTSAFGGDPVTVSAVVKNFGNLTIPRNWTDKIFLSDNEAFDPNQTTFLAARPAGGESVFLAPDSSYAFMQTVELPVTSAGAKWLHVVADATNAKLELVETNNARSTIQAINISLLPPPDLQPMALNAPASVVSGQTISVTATIQNNAAANYAGQTAWTDNFYLSQNSTIDASDILLGQAVHADGIDAGGVYDILASLPIPISTNGSFYLLIKADANDNLFEYTFENNNVLASPNLLNITYAPASDLVVTSMLLSTDSMIELLPYSLSWTTKNQGNSPAIGQIRETVYCSQDAAWDGFSGSFDSIGVFARTANWATGDSSTYTVNFVLPNLPTGGIWYAYIRTDADNRFFEADGEGNNLTRSEAIAVTERFADLQITAFSTPASATSGSTFEAQWSASNAGPVPTGTTFWSDYVYLSTDAILSYEDRLLGYKERSGILTPNAGYNRSLPCSLPNGLSGSYYLLLSVAHDRFLFLNDNHSANNFMAVPVTLNVPALPDLVVTSLSMPSPVVAGESYWAHFSVKNQGTAAVNSGVSDRLFFGIAPNLDGAQGIGYRAASRSLAPQASYSDSVLVTVPSYANGYYYLLMRTDNLDKVYEHAGEDNNLYVGTIAGQATGSQQAITVLPATASQANLVVTEVTAPDSAMLGDWTSVQVEIKNMGTTDLQRNVRNMSYFSKDDSFDAATDHLQKALNIPLNLAPGDSTTQTLSAPLLTFEEGDHRALGRTNVTASVSENNLADNLAFAAAQTHVGVRVLALETPTVFALGQGAWHYYQFSVGDNQDVLVTLRTLAGLNNGRLFVGHNRIPTSDDFDFTDDEANGTRTVIIPTCAAGTYYVLAQVLVPYASQPQTEVLVRALPFSVVSANPNHLGRGKVTSTVIGAGFTENTTAWELRQGGTTLATGTPGQFFNSMKMNVRWNLVSVPVGTYDLIALKADGQTATLAGGIIVEEAEAPRLTIIKKLPAIMRTGPWYDWSFAFVNTGNLDVEAAECPLYTESNGTIVSVVKSPNILTRNEFFPETFDLPAVEERNGYYRIMMWMKNIQPGEAGYATITVRGYPEGEVPIRIGAIPYTKEQFLKKQAYIIELQRQAILNHPDNYLNHPEIVAAAASQTGFRDSMLLAYVVNGFATRADLAAMDFHFSFYDFCPALSEGKAIYQNTSFAPGGTYLWGINLDKALGGAAGTNPGWDLIHATGTIEVAATAADPFIIILASKSPCSGTLEHLTTWEPWHDYRWPIAVADAGWENFSLDKFKLESSVFANTNNLYGGQLQLELSGDTLYLHFVHRDRLPGEPGCNGGLGLCGYPGGTGGEGGVGAPGGNGGDGENGTEASVPSPGGKGGKGGQQALGGAGGQGGNGDADQNGADGGAGGQGGDGITSGQKGAKSMGDEDLTCGGGGPGGDGGDGSFNSSGGNGGDGGDGGFSPNLDDIGGTGGDGGDGGNGGTGGNGGVPGDGGTEGSGGETGVQGDEVDYSAPLPDDDGETSAKCSSGRKWAGLKCAWSLVDCAADVVLCSGAAVATAGLATPCYIWAGAGCAIGITDDCGGAAFGKCGDGLLGGVPCGSDPFLATAGLAFGNPPGLTDAIGAALDCVDIDDDDFVSSLKPRKKPFGDKDPFEYDGIPVRRSSDPNDIIGPTGLDSARWISKFDTLNFHVNFENDSMLASAAAQRVTVRVPLHANLNPFSLRIGKFGFAGMTFDVPANKLNYTKVLDVADSLGVHVEITAGLDILNNEAFWIFQSIDPLTGLPPALPELGFLPINDSLGRGQGFVEYLILANSATATGDTATAKAEIVFDINDPILTNIWENTFDAVAPASTLDALAPVKYSTQFAISWSGADDAGGSGVDYYQLYFSENGGPFKRWSDQTSDNMVNFIGTVGSTYEFFTLATDRTGNREAAKSSGSITHIEGMTATVSTTKPSCPGGSDGSATVNRTGGHAPFHYEWSAANAGNTATISGLAPGNYTVMISDSNLPPLTVEIEFEVLDTVDLTAPTAICQNLTQALQASDTLAHFAAAAIGNGSADVCSAVMFSPATFNFGCGQLGPNTILLTVTDFSGNTATCSATLTVTDENGLCDPDADGDGYPLSVDCNDGNAAIHPNAPEICGIPGVDDDCDGTIDDGLFPPTIDCPTGPVTANTTTGQCTASVSYTATAAGTPTPTVTYSFSGATTGGGSGTGSGQSFNKGTTTVTITATNCVGLSAICSFLVVISDNEIPVLTVPAANVALNVIAGTCAADYTFTDPIADNCTGSTWSYVLTGATTGSTSGIADGTGSGAVSFNIGVTTVTFSATDGSNNVATAAQFTVTVTDNQPPLILNCVTTIVYATLNTLCKITIPNFTTTILATDNCSGTLTKTQSPVAGTQYASIHNQNFPVVISVTDANGNTSTCTRTVLAKDATKPPIYTCPASQTVALQASCQLLVPDKTGQLVSTDGCSNPVVKTQVPLPGLIASAPGMTHTIVFTATDGAGNTRTCTAILTATQGVCPLLLHGQNDGTTEAIAAPISGDETIEKPLPDGLGRVDLQTMPNPFSDELTIVFDLFESGKTKLVLMDLTGQFQFFEKENWLEKGRQKVVWNTDDLPGGAYFVGLKMESAGWIWRKVMLVR